MKFKFDKNLDYQLEAINSIVEIFDTGKNSINNQEEFKLQSSPIVANELEINEARILKNVQVIQKQNQIEPVNILTSLDFSVEMETGTGKTYIYLRTMLELNQKYGLKKFIVLVSSVAIREGVLKTIQQTKEHFENLYNAKYGYFAYDSKKLSRVREFTQSLGIQIMIMTIQSFNKDQNIMRQTPDRFNGESPLDLVAQARSVVIMDEPQNMESELSRSAIADLKPLFKLRYSATHKQLHNLMYRLTPLDAYQQGLVKKIEVFATQADDPNQLLFKVKEIIAKRGQLPQAKVLVEVKSAKGQYSNKEITFKAGDSLATKTGNNKYADLMVNEIDARTNQVELSNGNFFTLEEPIGVNKEAIFRAQIRETIKAHMKKQENLGARIKVLSLFFIDRVENYYSDRGIIRQIFQEEFNNLKSHYSCFKKGDVSQVHNGYFACTKHKGQAVYKNTSGKTKADKEVYDLIMKDKEKLLSFSEPTAFIFSHSALKEGWDNPNVFQICTLREVGQEREKRQQIGRGLRLAVNTNGDRIFDKQVNTLTVVANESYQEFVARLQTEYLEAGYSQTPQPVNAREKVTVKFNKYFASQNQEFKILWEQIRKRTKYNIFLKTKVLVKKAIESINQLNIKNLVVRIDKVQINFDKTGQLKIIYQNTAVGGQLKTEIKIPDLIARISKETGLTKKTVFDVLVSVNNLTLLFKNPEDYLRSVIYLIKSGLNELIINEGLEYLPTNDVWELNLFEDFISYSSKTIPSQKSIYDRVTFDSDGERRFAESLEQSSQVKLFTKLPSSFVVETPLGNYNPDWAIVIETDSGDKLYLVRESKFVDNLENLRSSELQKIACAQKHFQAIDVNFKVIQKEDLRDLN